MEQRLNARHCSFDELLQEADFVSVHTALTETTKNLFDIRAFTLMKENSVFVNTSRGGVVDHTALYQALDSGQIFAAGSILNSITEARGPLLCSTATMLGGTGPVPSRRAGSGVAIDRPYRPRKAGTYKAQRVRPRQKP